MSTSANGCCPDPSPAPHPFDQRWRRSERSLSIFEAKNPIPDQVTDTDKVSKLFETLKLVPYAGYEKKTGHKLLNFYLDLARLSPTHAACIEKIVTYVVGSKAKFERAEDPEYEPGTEETEMTANESAMYMQALKEVVIFEEGVRDYHKRVLTSAKATGDAFVEVVITTVNGKTKAMLHPIRRQDVLYKATLPGAQKAVAISPSWDSTYLKKNPPRILPCFIPGSEQMAPTFVEQGGVMRAVFHLKVGGGYWYGRPDSQGADIYKYREMQDSIYVTKQSGSNFLGQVFIEVEDDDPVSGSAIDDEAAKRAGFNSFADRIEQNYTMKGDDPQSVFVSARPQGARPMSVHQIKPNTNESWYKVTGEISEQKIVRAHGLTLRFMGFDVSNGFATDAFVADYVMNVEPVINDLRAELMAFTNNILKYVWDESGMPEMNQYSITFESPIKSKIEEYKQSQQPQQNQNLNQPQDVSSSQIDNAV